jgi:hypothetical protein
MICGDRVRVYALEKDRPAVPSEASAFHNEAFRNSFGELSGCVSFELPVILAGILTSLKLFYPFIDFL